VWVASELYYPEETSTGFLLTRIAEGLAESFDVHVICGQPTYSARGRRAPRRERRNRVEIERCWSTTLDKDRLPLRLLNAVTISASMFATALRRFRRGDSVLVVTNPPFLPFVIAAAARLRGARPALIVHDVYPEVLTAAGLAGEDSAVTRLAGALTRALYRGVDRIVVLGRDMHALTVRKLGPEADKIVIIPNWATSTRSGPRRRPARRCSGITASPASSSRSTPETWDARTTSSRSSRRRARCPATSGSTSSCSAAGPSRPWSPRRWRATGSAT
jgi:hypothetical protein